MLIELYSQDDNTLLKGRPVPEEPTDQECPHCGLWFSSRGIDTHTDTCPVRDSPFLHFDGVRLTARKCPDCGAWGGVHLEACSKAVGLESEELDPHATTY